MLFPKSNEGVQSIMQCNPVPQSEVKSLPADDEKGYPYFQKLKHLFSRLLLFFFKYRLSMAIKGMLC